MKETHAEGMLVADDCGWFSFFVQRLRCVAPFFVVLSVAGFLLGGLQYPVWAKVEKAEPALNLPDLEGALGQGIVVGLFSGFRTLMADLLYLQANAHWEKREWAQTEALMALTTSVDPEPTFFWLNRARITAYDVPHWRIRQLGRFYDVPEGVRQKIFEEQAQRGIEVMDEAQKFHPGDYRIPLQRAQILSGSNINDLENAAYWYFQASLSEGAPYFIGRIYAELLRRLDRSQEAYDYLRSVYPTLPLEDPYAAKGVVLERIRELEEELNTPWALRLPLDALEL